MPKEIYEWFIQHPDVRVETYYDTIFKQLCIHMVLDHFHRFHIKCMVEDFDVINDINKLLVTLDHLYEELIKQSTEYIREELIKT